MQIERERLVAEHAAALHLVSRLELALRRIGAHAAPDQQLLREAARFLELAGLRSSAGLHAAASPPWAGEPAPWKRGG